MLDCGMQCDTKTSLRKAHSTVPDLKEQRASQFKRSQQFDEVKAPHLEDEMKKNSDHLQEQTDVPCAPKGNVKSKVKNFEFLKKDEVSIMIQTLIIGIHRGSSPSETNIQYRYMIIVYQLSCPRIDGQQ